MIQPLHKLDFTLIFVQRELKLVTKPREATYLNTTQAFLIYRIQRKALYSNQIASTNVEGLKDFTKRPFTYSVTNILKEGG